MPRFAANLTMMFNEVPFAQRFERAAQAGFTAVEFLFPYALPPETVSALLKENHLRLVLFNLPPGDWDRGERGLAALPARRAEISPTLELALRYADATGARQLHMMAGISEATDGPSIECYRDNVHACALRLAAEGIDLLLEPINRRSMPGYFLDDFTTAAELIRTLALPNLKLQFDVFHRQILHGDVVYGLREMMPIIGHIQVAGVPSRHEPDGEELNFPFLFAEIDRLGFAGHIGCEYIPRDRTEDGLGWFTPYRRQAGAGS